MRWSLSRALLALAACALGASALPFRVASLFSSGMILQRDAPASAWGWATPGATVYGALINAATNVTLLSSGVADASGAWSVPFPAQPKSFGVYRLLLTTSIIDEQRCDLFQFYCSGASVTFGDIAFGDILIGLGQSNMQVNVGFVFNSTAELAAANYYSGFIKIFQVSASATSNDGPLEDFAGPPSIPWSSASNVTLPSFSATLWFSAKSVADSRPAEDRDVLLGLIAAPWGGTAIKAHAPISVNATCGALYPYPYGQNAGDCGMDHAPCNASTLFNSLIAPIAGPKGFPVAAMIWLQGENDCTASEVSSGYYACELAHLASSLRAVFAAPSAPWVTVTLAPYTGGATLGPFRDMQCTTTWGAIANGLCAVTVDDGDPLSPIGSVHSRNKQLVGRRVAAVLVPALYAGAPSPTGGRGPQYAGAVLASAADGTLTADVSFVPATLGGGGLVYVAPHATPWSNSSRCPVELGVIRATDCDWVYVLGSDGVAYNATISIGAAGDTLHLVAAAPPGVKAVGTRYGYNAWPVVNIYNNFSLPMLPWNVTE